MITLLKLAGMSALLSAGVVTAYDAPATGVPPASGKIFAERLGAETRPITLAEAEIVLPVVVRGAKGDAPHRSSTAEACAGQAWPYISADCAVAANGASVRKVSRTITTDGGR